MAVVAVLLDDPEVSRILRATWKEGDTFLSLSEIEPKLAVPRDLPDMRRRRAAKVHFHIPPTHRSDTARLVVRLHARRGGAFGTVTAAAAVTAAALVVAADRAPRLDEQTSAAVLLIVPTVLLAYLTRPGEHIYATRLLLGVRLLGGIAALCSLAFAVMLGTGFFDTDGGNPPVLLDAGAGRAANVVAFVAVCAAALLAVAAAAPWLGRLWRAPWGAVIAVMRVLAFPSTLAQACQSSAAAADCTGTMGVR